MSGSDEGRKYIQSNCLDLLQATNIIEFNEKTIFLKTCPILEKWKKSDNVPFEDYFKIELLSKIVQSKNPYVGYFSNLLGDLLDFKTFDTAKLELSMKEARLTRGIPLSGAEELGGKIEFYPQFLTYFHMIQRIGNNWVIYIPRKLLKLIFSLAIEDLNKPCIRLYNELFEHIDSKYLPILNKKETRLLNRILFTINNPVFLDFFNFSDVPDGGRIVILNNKEYNAIISR